MHVLALSAVLLTPFAFVHAQLNPGVSPSLPPPSAATQPSQAESGVLTFRVTSREVVLDVIALDRHGTPVSDLTQADLRVSYAEEHHRGSTMPQEIAPITSLRIVDPTAPLPSSDSRTAGFQITASCLDRSTVHYQLAFRPEPRGWTSGYHRVSVSTFRRGVRLFYRHRYFVGQTIAPPKPPITESNSIEKVLAKDACYYPDTPLSISMKARLIESDGGELQRYQITVDASSLSYLSLAADTAARQPLSVSRRVQIDYGACSFNAAGRPIGFFWASVDQVLTSADYARALAHGFPHILQFQASPSMALTRFVVRDRATGNLGAADVPLAGAAFTSTSAAASDVNSAPEAGESSARSVLVQETLYDLRLFQEFSDGAYEPPPPGPIGSFGSVVPATDSFCGDVYELDQPSSRLPDFRELDPIGSIYTQALDVPSQLFTNTNGIPGVTPRTNLFGIDYHAMFWIRKPGDYRFRMVSDDGAILWIDDRQLIPLDGLHPARGGSGTIHLDPGPHTLHIPYYQGAITSVALLLWVRPPNEKDWKIFDLRNFAPPSATER